MSDKVVTIAGQQVELFLEREATRFRAGDVEIELTRARDNEAEVRVGDRTFVAPYVVDGTRAVSVWIVRGTENGNAIEARGVDLWEFRGDKVLNKDTYWKLRSG